jgi:hypothetical protein
LHGVGLVRCPNWSTHSDQCWLPPSCQLIGYVVWLCFRLPLSLRMVDQMMAARGISITYETIRKWDLKFSREFANRIR